MRAAFLISLLLLAAPAYAQEKPQNPAAAKSKLLSEQKQREEEAAKLKAEADAVNADLSTLQERLVRASAKERELAERMGSLITRTRALEAQELKIKTALEDKRQNLASLLIALGRLSRLPPEIGLLREQNTKDAIHSALLLERALPEVRDEARELSASLAELDKVQTELTAERNSLTEARTAQNAEQAAIEKMITLRQKKLRLTSKQQTEIAARIDRLRSEAATMDELIRKVAGPKVPGKPAPVMALRGGFLQPVSGKLERGYGQEDESGAKDPGLSFKIDPGTRIVAPASGRVMFSGPFRGYGQIVILEHDEDMHSLISGFGRMDVTTGQKVSQGEPLGVTPPKGDGDGMVYFELRRQGEAIDPRLKSR